MGLVTESAGAGNKHEVRQEDGHVDVYGAWLVEHPSALESFEAMIALAGGKNLSLFLDYDGTLSPIVNEPDRAFMSDAMRTALHEVAKVLPTSIVTGRSIDKVYDFVKLENVVYAGSHGMDISTLVGSLKYEDDEHQTKFVDAQGNKIVKFQPAHNFLPKIKQLLEVLEEKVKTIEGATVEDNRFCVSVHYRLVDEQDVDKLKEIVQSTINSNYPNFRITGGNMVMEIRPSIDWDKGRAMEYLLDIYGSDSSGDYLPIYIGDDKTDEDAFKVVRGLEKGFPILVSSVPKETMASYSLRNPDEVMAFLIRLAKWKNDELAAP